MAHALSFGEPIRFVWRVNEHCPVHHTDIWNDGVPGVEMIYEADEGFATRISGKMIYDWGVGSTSGAVAGCYRRIFDAMSIKPRPSPPKVAIVSRLYRQQQGNLESLAYHASKAVTGHLEKRLLLLADSERADIARRIEGFDPSICIEHASAPELITDLARSKDDVLSFVSDWRTALAARTIITLDGPTTLLHQPVHGASPSSMPDPFMAMRSLRRARPFQKPTANRKHLSCPGTAELTSTSTLTHQLSAGF